MPKRGEIAVTEARDLDGPATFTLTFRLDLLLIGGLVIAFIVGALFGAWILAPV